MIDILEYCRNSIYANDKAIDCLKSQLEEKTKANKNLAMILSIVAIYSTIIEFDRRRKDKRIKKLNKQVKDLKRDKGE